MTGDLVSELLALDREHVWHPYSAMGGDQPVYPVTSAAGVRLQLADGRELIDGMSSWWCAIHGYNHPAMNRALVSQLKAMAHVMFGGLTHQPAVDLATRLVELTPAPLQKVFFADSGSVAVEVAMKMAIQYWHARGQSGKQHFLALRCGYHGDTFGAMSVCDPVTGMHALFNEVLAQQFFVESPSCRYGDPCEDQDIEPLSRQLAAHAGKLAAVILEPVVQGAGGMRFYAADYLRQVRELCDHYRVLLIHDEIATGFGRTGKLFACEHFVTPDVLVLGKSLGGGLLPFAGIVTHEKYNICQHRSVGHYTHEKNALCSAAALAEIAYIVEHKRHEHAAELGDYTLKRLSDLKEKHPLIGHVAGLGLHIGIDLVSDSKTRERAVDEAEIIMFKCLEKGLSAKTIEGNVLTLRPALVITREQMDRAIDIIDEVIGEVEEGKKYF